MVPRIALLSVVALCLAAPSVARADTHHCSAVVFFGNGVDVAKPDAERDLILLRLEVNAALAQAGRPPLPKDCFRLSYATNEGLVMDLFESTAQQLGAAYSLMWRWWLRLEVGPRLFYELVDVHLALFDAVRYLRDDDLRKQTDDYAAAIVGRGRPVVIVAHSQGNFFANAAHHLLTTYYTVSPHDFRIVPVATPAVERPSVYRHVTLFGDIIALIAPLQPNTRATASQSHCEHSALPWLAPLNLINAWYCHAFSGTYLLGESNSRAAILEAVLESIPLTPPPPVTEFAFAAGTYSVSGTSFVGTAFLFDPVVAGQTVDSVEVSGPTGWNANLPLTVLRYQPPATAASRSLSFSGMPAVTGAYTATTSVGGSVRMSATSLDAASMISAPEITGVSAVGTSATVNWTAMEGASFAVYLHSDPVGHNALAQAVVASTERSHTFSGVALTGGQTYRAEVFALSQDILTPGPFGSVFNVSSSGAVPFVAATPIILQPGPGEGKDIWTTSVFSYSGSGPGGGLDDHKLWVGGWGDQYYSLLQFKLDGLPQRASLVTLELYAYDELDRPGTPMHLDRIVEFWDWRTQGTGADFLRLWWADRPAVEQWSTVQLPAPSVNSWYGIDVTSLYNAWQAGTYPNFGFQLRPVLTSGQFNTFYSSDYEGNPGLRPRLVIHR